LALVTANEFEATLIPPAIAVSTGLMLILLSSNHSLGRELVVIIPTLVQKYSQCIFTSLRLQLEQAVRDF
jgi:hypothetical protein